MDPPPSADQPPYTHSLPPLPTTKLRLMCSYNGHILPRPQTNSLTYAAGETRIVAVDRRTTAATVTALTHHLSRTLYNNQPFTLKYQLPNEDLDSLVTISTDEDLQNMLEEHDRIVGLLTNTRIRLFLFPKNTESGTLLGDAKSEMWFSDALKSSMIGKHEMSDGSGSGSGSVQESMVLETCSSFGSINSSVNEDGDKKGKLESDSCGRIPDSLPTVNIQQRNVQVSGYQIQQQPVQYIQTGTPHYVQYPTGQVPMPSYYPMYVPYQQQQQQQYQYQQQQPNQPYPIYVMPMGPTDQSYNMVSGPADLNGNVARPPLHTHIANTHVAVVPQVTQSNIVPSHVEQPVGPIATPTIPTYENEYDNDLAYAQIYKSQPSAPVFPTQKFETMKITEQVPSSDN